MVWLEGIFKAHLVQPPCDKQGYLQLDQDDYTSVQPDLKPDLICLIA